MSIDKLSTEQLLEELKKRQVEEALSIDEKIKNITPKPIDNPNLDALVAICTEYINDSIEKSYVDEDLDVYITETAMKTIFGKDVYSKLREIDKLKKLKK